VLEETSFVCHAHSAVLNVACIDCNTVSRLSPFLQTRLAFSIGALFHINHSLADWWMHVQVNLVATQLVLDREHTNRLVFVDGQGLDPNMDLKFRGPNLRALIQGPASSWQSHLTLTPTGGSGGLPCGPIVRS